MPFPLRNPDRIAASTRQSEIRGQEKMASETLLRALEDLKAERFGDFSRSFDSAAELIAEYGEDNLAERLYADIPADCPWEVVADLFGILIWETSDNGSALCRTTDRWLWAGSELRRVQIALALDVYPSVREEQLKELAVRFPEVALQCYEWIARFKKLRPE
jgi:hypothetical protein